LICGFLRLPSLLVAAVPRGCGRQVQACRQAWDPLPVPQRLVDETGAKVPTIRPQAVAGTWAALVLVTASGLSVADRAGFAQT